MWWYLWRGRRYSSGTTQAYGRLITVITPLLSLTLLFYIVSFQLLHFTFVRANDNDRLLTFSSTVSPLLSQSRFLHRADAKQPLQLALGLRPDNSEELQTALKGLDRNGQRSAIEQFSPSQDAYRHVISYLRENGFTVTHTYTHRLFISFQGTVAQVENVFHTPINLYSTPERQVFYANSQEPQLPDWLRDQASGLYGLNNATRWQHAMQPAQNNPGSEASALIHQCPHANVHTLVPQQIASAYGLDVLYQRGNHGEGQNVALFELAPIRNSDISTYASCFGLNTGAIQIHTIDGSQPSDAASSQASESDVELLLSAVPQARNLSVYEATNNESSYLAQWASILDDDVPVIATGWGICETATTNEFLQQEHFFFTLAALQGQNIFAASSGTRCPHYNSNGVQKASFAASDPAAQPYVIGVGGSELNIQGSAYSTETAWTPPFTGSVESEDKPDSDTRSRYWPLPTWQHTSGLIAPAQSSQNTENCQGQSCRNVPDVAFNASPDHGYWTYCSLAAAGCTPERPWQSIGGTAAGAIYWAALFTLTNQIVQQQGGTQISFAAPLLYQIASDPIAYAHSFHDIVMRNNVDKKARVSNVGYDSSTGLGSYQAWNLVQELLQRSSAGEQQHKQVQFSGSNRK